MVAVHFSFKLFFFIDGNLLWNIIAHIITKPASSFMLRETETKLGL